MTVLEGKFQRSNDALSITLKTDLLYIDDFVAVLRLTCTLNGKLSSMRHITMDLKAGSSVH